MLLKWFVSFVVLTAASAVPLMELLVECFVSLAVSCSLRSARILFGLTQKNDILIVIYFCDWREVVNVFFTLKGWLIVDVRGLKVDRYAVKRGQSVSITYETLGTGYELTGDDFQNTGAFMVVRSSVFSVCSAHNRHLARDAYYACSRWA